MSRVALILVALGALLCSEARSAPGPDDEQRDSFAQCERDHTPTASPGQWHLHVVGHGAVYLELQNNAQRKQDRDPQRFGQYFERLMESNTPRPSISF